MESFIIVNFGKTLAIEQALQEIQFKGSRYIFIVVSLRQLRFKVDIDILH